MIRVNIQRRQLLVGVTGLLAASMLPFRASATNLTIHVMKDPDCGCCVSWIEILEQDGFTVTTENLGADQLRTVKVTGGIPDAMMSCHTGRIGGYAIEGHVPAVDIRRLLIERPDAIGLSVPGMPYGSPGMGPEEERDAYDVYLIRPDGQTEVFSRYDAA